MKMGFHFKIGDGFYRMKGRELCQKSDAFSVHFSMFMSYCYFYYDSIS